jgi:hypothetical protein
MNSSVNGNYAIAEDGTIKRPYNELFELELVKMIY